MPGNAFLTGAVVGKYGFFFDGKGRKCNAGNIFIAGRKGHRGILSAKKKIVLTGGQGVVISSGTYFLDGKMDGNF